MERFTNGSITTVLVASLMFGLMGTTFAATTPSLGDAESFGVLSSTYTNTAAGTINGDLGYTTPSVTATTVNGLVFTPKPPQAGLDQGAALADLNSQPCTFTFASGAVDLASDTAHGTTGVYEPGVYCAPAAMSIGTTGIILSGAGTFIFRSAGALNTVANSSVIISNGASACDIFWTPIATTLGANSIFIGTVIDNAGITVGSTVSWIGRALDFATTVTTNNATITVPICASTAPATLHIIKQVINDNGGTALASIFSIYVQRFGINILGSPASGTVAPGIAYPINPGTYTISEMANAGYTQSFSGDCSSTGSIKLLPGDNKTCTVVNDDIAAPTPSIGGGGGSMLVMDNCPNGDYSTTYYDSLCGTAPLTGSIIMNSGVSELTGVATPIIIPATGSIIPKFPKTGLTDETNTTPWALIILGSIFVIFATTISVKLAKHKI